MLEINISANIKEISKKLNDLAYKELPFATARALTELAREVQAAERFAMESVFEKPKGFTVNSVSMFGATKNTLTAGVFVKDTAAKYLSPFADGGEHFLNPGQTTLHVPIAAPVDIGGNLRRGYERRGNARKSVFYGVVQTKKGPVNGMWQRTVVRQAGPNGKLRKVHKLKLLVEYVADKPVRQHLEFFDRAQKLVNRRYQPVLGRELAKAIASSRLK